MNWVKYDEYNDLKIKFFTKHHNDFSKEESGTSAEYYRKTYVFADNAIWYEVMTKEYVSSTVNIYGCKIPVEVPVLRTEFWTNETSESTYYFEPWNNKNEI